MNANEAYTQAMDCYDRSLFYATATKSRLTIREKIWSLIKLYVRNFFKPLTTYDCGIESIQQKMESLPIGESLTLDQVNQSPFPKFDTFITTRYSIAGTVVYERLKATNKVYDNLVKKAKRLRIELPDRDDFFSKESRKDVWKRFTEKLEFLKKQHEENLDTEAGAPEFNEPPLFDREDSKHVSAILYCNQFTVPRHKRMATSPGTLSKSTTIRFGFYFEPDDKEGIFMRPYEFYLNDKNTPKETWSEGVSILHNPNAEVPLTHKLLPSSSVVSCTEEEIIRELEGFHPIISFMISQAHR